jgi:predicted GNAT superfamily acetyltransferase
VVTAANEPLAYSREALLDNGAHILNEAERSQEDLPLPTAEITPTGADKLLIEIPADFQKVKRQDMALAIEWRAHTRGLFERSFEQGYQVTGFVRHEADENFNRSYYLLEKEINS